LYAADEACVLNHRGHTPTTQMDLGHQAPNVKTAVEVAPNVKSGMDSPLILENPHGRVPRIYGSRFVGSSPV
jgi:hypothetical protein